MSHFLRNSGCLICGPHPLKKNKFLLNIRNYAATSEEIVIPKRIPRGPTDILQALASTIKRDPTAPHNKFHDDPFLIPSSNRAKRIFALSQESGRKTAMWIREEHPELFQHREADPPIQTFMPKAVYDESDHVTNETLAKVIKTASVNDAAHVYKLILSSETEVSEDNKQNLLELLCFFNETEELAEELIEERWFSQFGQEKFTIKNTWKNDGLAEKLFKELPASGKTYSALIQGMVKFNQMEKAYLFYQQALDKGIPLSVNAYHAILKTTPFIKQGTDQRWTFIEEILHAMNDGGYLPNVRTLNIVLSLLSGMLQARDCKRFALKMIAEVKQFGVEPSLGSYYFLLKIFCSNTDSRVRSWILRDIMDNIEGKEFTIRDHSDTFFFSSAMEICSNYLNDIQQAYRVNNLLWQGRNYNLIGNSYKEAAYYRHFFSVILQCEDLETILKLYDYYVPNIYVPEMKILLDFIEVITMNGAVELYSKVWTDIVRFELADQTKTLQTLLKGMALNRPPLASSPSEVAVNLAEIAWSIYTTGCNQPQNREIEWTGEMLGNIILLNLNVENLERAFTIFTKLKNDENKVIGVPNFEVLISFLDACITHQDLKNGMLCVEYCAENGYTEALNLAKKFINNFHLGPTYTTRLIALLGQDILQDNQETNRQSNKNSEL